VVEVKIGIDIDGVLTLLPLRINFRLPWWFGIWLAFVPANKKMLRVLKKWKKDNHKIIIISERPKKLIQITKWWLRRYGVSYDQIFLNDGSKKKEEQKLGIIKREEINIFIEDDPIVFNFLKKNYPSLKIFFPKQVLNSACFFLSIFNKKSWIPRLLVHYPLDILKKIWKI